MKQILRLLILIFILASCKTSKDYLSRKDDDKSVFDVIKALNKRNSDTAAANALPVLYGLAQQRHLKKINNYSASNEITRWDKIISEYKTLQEMHDVITDANAASRIVTPVNYQPTIYNIKQQAAEEYYTEASTAFDNPGREDAKKSLYLF